MGERGLFNLSKTMLSVLPKELEYKVKKLAIKYKTPEVTTQLMINNSPNCQLVKKPSRISPHEVLQSRLINTVKRRIIRGGVEGLLTFFL